ncbi:MAG: carboxypeptidase M32 [Phycisphaerales bacterium]|nr:carboxypeptidase M32 [Phycisphaerales bacterium]
MSGVYEQLRTRIREIGQLSAVEAMLEWDQETYMPRNGLSARAEQLALVAQLAHERRTSQEVGELLAQLDGNIQDEAAATNVRETRRNYERATRVPAELVGRIARVAAGAREAWKSAREASQFSLFAPHLTELLELKREVADRIGFVEHRYDALLDEYEPGATRSRIAGVFDGLRRPLIELTRRLGEARVQPDPSILERHYPAEAQSRFARMLAETIGFDFKSGRLDISVHPFCSGTSPGDVRLTTRFNERSFSSGIFGVLHEAGHGLYEQGLDPEHSFTPRGLAVSLGIHESQSLMWECMIGKSHVFWEHFYPQCQQTFPEALKSVPLNAFVAAANAVRPSFIRVEADEVTYSLHIILRFELESAMIEGSLDVDDIPEAWNAKFESLLGIRPETDKDGCLQDIHWSTGTFGYFPTYSLGKLNAAQFFAAARSAMPDMDERIRRGEFATLREWLRENVHCHGQRYRADELVRRVTGQSLSSEPFLKYVRNKYEAIYGL